MKAASILPPRPLTVWEQTRTVAYRPRPYTWLPAGTSHRFHLLRTYRPAPLFEGEYRDVTTRHARTALAEMIRREKRRVWDAIRWKRSQERAAERGVKPPAPPKPPKPYRERKPRVLIQRPQTDWRSHALRAAAAIGVDLSAAFARTEGGQYNRLPESLRDRLRLYVYMRVHFRMTYPQIARACGPRSHSSVVQVVNRGIERGEVSEADSAVILAMGLANTNEHGAQSEAA